MLSISPVRRPSKQARFLRAVVSDQAARDLAAVGVLDQDDIAALEVAFAGRHPGGQQALARQRARVPLRHRSQSPRAPRVRPRSSASAPPPARRAERKACAAPIRSRARDAADARPAIRTDAPAAVAIFAATIFDSIPPRLTSETGPFAIASISGVIDSHLRDVLRGGIALRIGGVKSVDIGEQNQAIRFHHAGDARGQPIVVAETNLGRGHGVVFVDHRHGAEREERAQSFARIQITPPRFGILQREKNLRRRRSRACETLRHTLAPAAPGRRRPRPGFPPVASAPDLSPSARRPSATAPEETSSTSLPPPRSATRSATRLASHSRFSAPEPDRRANGNPL